jgi:hypothetical protein
MDNVLRNGILVKVFCKDKKAIVNILVPAIEVYFTRQTVDNKTVVIPFVMITDTYEVFDIGEIHD